MMLRKVKADGTPCLVFDGYAVLTLGPSTTFTVSVTGGEIRIATHILVECHINARLGSPHCL